MRAFVEDGVLHRTERTSLLGEAGEQPKPAGVSDAPVGGRWQVERVAPRAFASTERDYLTAHRISDRRPLPFRIPRDVNPAPRRYRPRARVLASADLPCPITPASKRFGLVSHPSAYRPRS